MEQIEYDEAAKKVVAFIDEEQGKKSSIPWNMMVYNTLKGIFPVNYYYIDNKICFQYMTEGYTSVFHYFQKKKGGFETIHFLCQEILSILEEGQEYLLEAREYLLEDKWIFWNRPEKKVMLCYLPGREESGEEEFIMFVEKLLQVTDHQDKKAVEFVYGLYDFIQSDGFSIEGMQSFIRKYDDDTGSMACSLSASAAPPDGFAKEKISKGISSEEKPVSTCTKKEMVLVYDSKNNGKELVDYSSYLEKLKYPLSGEKIVIGRSRFCDVCLPFGSISAKHAVISRQKDLFYLRDMQSSNGLYLNGERVTDFEKKALKTGDTVSFGGIIFTFKEKEQDLFDIPV